MFFDFPNYGNFVAEYRLLIVEELGPLDFNDDQWQAWTRLMKLTQEGDRDAYERLLAEISPLVFNFVRKRVFNQQYVEDVFQEVLLTFHKAKHTYRSDLPFAPWFFTVIRNAIWDVLSRNRRIAQREIPFEDFHDFAAQDAAEGGVDDRLHQALESLPEGNRQAVEMLKFRGMSADEASKELGISKIALRVRAHRGYTLLRKFLKTQRKKSK
jgi:RNA polymerase sigma-70 factor, ECF subfamily